MYVDPKPVSTYGETEGWRLPSPQPSGTLRRPPILKNGSSSSSLKGMEQTVPSFQSFVKRTPPLDQQKLLPPTPLRPRRPSSFESGSSRPSSSFGRRSSSVYSRTVSQWDPEWTPEHDAPDVPAIPSWRSVDFSDQNLLLRPIAYSASTSKLLEKQQPPQFLEPRSYDPLINTPSPTISRVSTPSPRPQPRPSVLLPPPPTPAHVPKQHLRTVSLEKAKEIMQAPGKVHLLPEELRAQTLGKSRSQKPLRICSWEIFAGKTPPDLPVSPTLIDNQGRERLVVPPSASIAVTDFAEYPFPAVASPLREGPEKSFHVGTGPIKAMAPIAAQTRQASRDKVVQALGLGDADEPRGRTWTRGPRNMSYDHYMPTVKRTSEEGDSSNDLQSDAHRIAQEYHTLLSEQYRQPSGSPSSNATESDTEVRAQMKMVPQPLFHSKPAGKVPDESNSVRNSDQSVSPLHGRADSGVAGDPQQCYSGSRGSFPLRLSLTPDTTRSRRSTSGSIPISPPSATVPNKVTFAPPPPPEMPVKKQSPRLRPKIDDYRASAYYPHVMSRKGKKDGKNKSKSRSKKDDAVVNAHAPPLPMLPTNISNTDDRSDAGSIRSNNSSRPMHQRLFKGAVEYADKLTRPTPSPNRKRNEETSPMRRVASPESPHLLPSPASSKSPPAMHLGWSDHAKTRFDKVRSSVQSSKHQAEPTVTHIQTAARPLDESRTNLNEPESPTRRSSIFGGFMDGWREGKAEKRREDLKKMIKVVTPANDSADTPGPARPTIPQRRMSAFNWM